MGRFLYLSGMTLHSTSYQELNGKDVYLINLLKNNLPTKRAEIKEALMDKHIIVDARPVKVIGIEMFATPEDADHKEVAIMVKML